MLVEGDVHRLQPVGRDEHGIARFLEDALAEPLRHIVVIRHQHRESPCRTGRWLVRHAVAAAAWRFPRPGGR